MELPPDNPKAEKPAPTVTDPARAGAMFAESAAIMARLRAPDGCPWDREQSFDAIRKYTLEETYEVFDAIERRDFPHLAEELGDLLLQVLFYAEMAANEGHFTISDVLDHLNRKLIRRHPHVFGDEASKAAGNRAIVDAAVEGSSAAVLRNWEEIKQAEKKPGSAQSGPASRLDTVQRAMPALAEAAKLGAKAQKAGFDWPSWRDLLPKKPASSKPKSRPRRRRPTIPRARPPLKLSLAICSSPWSTWAVTSAWMRRWRCAAAICASGNASARWSWPPHGLSKSSPLKNSKRYGPGPSKSSPAGSSHDRDPVVRWHG